jgi:enoyl-CoA hydratase
MGQELVLRQGIEPGVEMLTLNRPDKLNALSTPLVRALEAHLDAIAADRSVRAVIITGAGERAFVAGADIAEYRGRQSRAFIDYQRESRRVFCKIENLPQPVIAAVRGYALGGGFEIALCCDIIICAASARLGLPEGLLGLSPGGGGTQRLTRFVGKSKSMEMHLTGRFMDAAEAERSGLVSRVVPAAKLIPEAIATARKIAEKSQLAVIAAKESVNRAYETTLAEGLLFERRNFQALFATEDQKEGMLAFLEKREPQFRDR